MRKVSHTKSRRWWSHLENNSLLEGFSTSASSSVRPFFSGLLHDRVHLLQHVLIKRLAEFGAAEDAFHTVQDALENGGRVGDENRTRRRPADDQQLGRLQQHLDIAVLHEIAADHGAKDGQNAY